MVSNVVIVPLTILVAMSFDECSIIALTAQAQQRSFPVARWLPLQPAQARLAWGTCPCSTESHGKRALMSSGSRFSARSRNVAPICTLCGVNWFRNRRARHAGE